MDPIGTAAIEPPAAQPLDINSFHSPSTSTPAADAEAEAEDQKDMRAERRRFIVCNVGVR